MRLDTFFEKFHELAETPGAIRKVKEMVLQLATLGKLVDQRAGEASAIDCVRASNKPLLDIDLARSVDNPTGWATLPLGCLIASNTGGGTPSKRVPAYWNGPIPWASVKDIQQGKYLTSTIDSITELGLINSSANLIPPNRIIMVTRISLGKLAINAIPVAINQDLRAIEPTNALDLDYAYLLLGSLKLVGSGVTVKGITVARLHHILVSIPPVAEQKRIVAKFDEIMLLCDRLQVQHEVRETKEAAVALASLDRFSEAPTTENLGYLFRPSYKIHPADLRKSILSIAVRGGLVHQEPADGLASDLLTTLTAERDRFARTNNYRPYIPEPIATASVPFKLPASWTWCRLGAILNAITDGDHVAPPRSSSGIAFLTIGNITTGRLDFARCRYVPETYYQALAKFRRPARGDIMYTVVGATYGRPAFVDTDRPFCVQRHIAILKPSDQLDVRFLLAVLRSPLVYDQAKHSATGTAQPTIPLGALRNFIIPLPPAAEQRRIAEELDRLMTLVETLEAQVETSRAAGARLLDALIDEVMGVELGRNLHRTSDDMTPTPVKPDIQTNHVDHLAQLTSTARRFSLRRFAMWSGYRSLGEFDCVCHRDTAEPDTGPPSGASPVCLVGLNGSGKSNFIEALAEVFCFLELINLPWNKVASSSSRYRENGHRFLLEYIIEDDRGSHHVQISKSKKSGAEFNVLTPDGTKIEVQPGLDQLMLLPRRIVGYSSGLNETVSHPFLRTKTIYSEEVRDAAPRPGEQASAESSVFDTRTLYMDYESNAAILISNYIFCPPAELAVFEEYTRVSGISSFGVRFNRKRAGKSGENSVVRLTSELDSYLRSFALCAGVSYNSDKPRYSLSFTMEPATIALFRQEFKTADNLFMAMHKLSLLNALILSDLQRKVYLRSDITKGALERPPSVPPSDRVFDIVDLKLTLSSPPIDIDYSGISDGEHQFIQVFGTVLLFSAPGALFLFDEPESHFNPEWRTNFNLILNTLPHADRQEYVISTHSPFIVSGSRMGNVFKFTRTQEGIRFDPVDFETYGASFDALLKKLFSVDSLIDQSARQDLQQIIKRGVLAEMQDAVEGFAESREKRRLYEAIIQKG